MSDDATPKTPEAIYTEIDDDSTMSDPRYTTTTTVVETTEYLADDGPTVRVTVPKADLSYVRTLGGLTKIVCIILCFLCFFALLIGGPAHFSGVGWATFVSTIGFSVTTTLLLLYIFRVVDALQQVPWIVGEMCFCFAWTIFFFIAACVLAVASSQHHNTFGWAFASMSDPRYTTTTTVVETTEYLADDGPTVRVTVPKADLSYVRTLGGLTKIVCIILCFLCFFALLIGGPAHFSGVGWATFVSTIGFSVTTTLLLLYIFRVVDALQQVPWIVGEMCFCFAWTIFFFIAACVLAVASSQHHNTFGWAFASFFAFGAMCAYGFDCYLKFLSWRNDEVATGGGTDFIEQARRRAAANV